MNKRLHWFCSLLPTFQDQKQLTNGIRQSPWLSFSTWQGWALADDWFRPWKFKCEKINYTSATTQYKITIFKLSWKNKCSLCFISWYLCHRRELMIRTGIGSPVNREIFLRRMMDEISGKEQVHSGSWNIERKLNACSKVYLVQWSKENPSEKDSSRRRL